MEMTMPLRDARDTLGQRVDAAHFADEHTVITRNGTPRAVLVSYDWYQRLQSEVGHAGADVGQTSTRSASVTLAAESLDVGPEQQNAGAEQRNVTTSRVDARRHSQP